MRKKRMGWLSLLAAVSIVMTGFTGAQGAPAPPPGTAAGHTVPAPHAGTTTDTATTDTATTGTAAGRQQDDLAGDITFSVPSGTFKGELSVSLSTTVGNAQIRYTTDGKPPTASSPAYSGTPLRFTRTTQLRAQAFVGGTATGEPGTALYVARSHDATHDLPLMVMDAYGAGKPGREYADVATLVMEPQAGTTSLAAAPTVATRAGFHLRGQSSAMFEKAPYRLELRDNQDDDADLPMLGMPADSDWVLRGPFADKSLIHDAFAYSLGRDMGLQAPRFRFVELYLNLDGQPLGADDYQGVYMLVETIKNAKNRLDLKQLDEDDLTEPAVTGGYIFAFEWFAAEEPTLQCTGTASTCWRDLEVKDPSPLQPEQRTWLTRYVQRFHDALHGPNPSDPQTGYPAYIDVNSFVDKVIIQELTREMDSYIRSTYFHKDRNGKIVAGPLWDFDLTFGTGGYFNNQQIQGWQFEQTRQPAANDWFIRLMDDPAFVQKVNARWRELRQGVLSDSRLAARITELATPLAGAAQRNFQKWPNLTSSMVGPFMTPTAATWQGQVQYMRDWLARRVAWLDSSGWRPSAG